MICFPLLEGEQITQILLGLFLEIFLDALDWDVFTICFWTPE